MRGTTSRTRGTNPILRKLAHAIIANQRFEIAVLDDIRRRVGTEPETVLDLGFARIVRRQTGVDGLEHQWQFVKRRPPGILDFALAPGRGVGARREVLEGDDAPPPGGARYGQGLQRQPEATNLILRRLNLDIIVDQADEIGLLRQIVDRFPGNPMPSRSTARSPAWTCPWAKRRRLEGGMDHGTGH